MVKIRRNSHLILRGAIRKNSNLIIPIIVHAISVFLQFIHLSVNNGTYVASYGGVKNIFISATLHIQGIVVKKFLPKISEGNPVLQESTQRITAWIAFLHHSLRNPIRTGLPILFFEYGFALLRYIFVSLSDENEKFLKSFSKNSARLKAILLGEKCSRDESLLICISNEAYAIVFLFLFIGGNFFVRIIILIVIIVFGILGLIGDTKQPEEGQKVKDEIIKSGKTVKND